MTLGLDASTKKHPYFPGIDAVRFFAACLVIVVHYGTTVNLPVESAAVTRGTWFGWIGVEIFFVISGLVIANAANTEAPAAFLKSRILRLYPAAWICSTLSLVAMSLAGVLPLTALLTPYFCTLLLLPKWGQIDVVYWTLTVEIAFYGMVFMLLAARRFALLPALTLFLTLYSGIFVSALFLSDLDIHILLFQSSLTAFSSHLTITDLLLLRHGCLFAVGVWLWLLAQHISPARIIALALACVFSLEEIVVSSFDSLNWQHTVGPQAFWIPAAIWFAAIAAIAVSLTVPRHQPNPALRSLGLMTYPLYLIHYSVGGAILMALSGMFPITVAVSASAGILLILSWLISHYGEPAIRTVLRPLLNRMLGITRFVAFGSG